MAELSDIVGVDNNNKGLITNLLIKEKTERELANLLNSTVNSNKVISFFDSVIVEDTITTIIDCLI